MKKLKNTPMSSSPNRRTQLKLMPWTRRRICQRQPATISTAPYMAKPASSQIGLA
jgi:hypothetical protein